MRSRDNIGTWLQRRRLCVGKHSRGFQRTDVLALILATVVTYWFCPFQTVTPLRQGTSVPVFVPVP